MATNGWRAALGYFNRGSFAEMHLPEDSATNAASQEVSPPASAALHLSFSFKRGLEFSVAT
jgi:hypothetical protein